jgi:hypothetical protein
VIGLSIGTTKKNPHLQKLEGGATGLVRRVGRDAGAAKRNAPAGVGAQFATGILYHKGNAGQI